MHGLWAQWSPDSNNIWKLNQTVFKRVQWLCSRACKNDIYSFMNFGLSEDFLSLSRITARFGPCTNVETINPAPGRLSLVLSCYHFMYNCLIVYKAHRLTEVFKNCEGNANLQRFSLLCGIANFDFWFVACEKAMTPKPLEAFQLRVDHARSDRVGFHAPLSLRSLTLSVELTVANSELDYKAQFWVLFFDNLCT